MDQETEIEMKITKINPKTPLEEAIAKTSMNFAWLYELLDKRIAYMDNLLEKRFVKRSDKALALELGLLLHGQKILFQISEDHAKFIYGIRDIVAEYGNAIEELSTHIELLANESTNKELTNRVLREHVTLKEKMSKVEQKADDVRSDIEDFDKWRDDIARKFSKDGKKDG